MPTTSRDLSRKTPSATSGLPEWLARIAADPKRPFDAHYYDLNCVPWYARRCEYRGCNAYAEDCHHKHYRTVGVETNADLEALCRPHHEARHQRFGYVSWDNPTAWSCG